MKTKDVLKHLFKFKAWQKWPKSIRYATLSLIIYVVLAFIVFIIINTINNWNTLTTIAALQSQGYGDIPFIPLNPKIPGGGVVPKYNFSIFSGKDWEALLLWIIYIPFFILYELVSGMGQVFDAFAKVNLNQIFGLPLAGSGNTLNDWYNLIALICLAFISLLIIFAVLKSWLTYTNNKNINIVGNLGFKIISALLLLIAMPMLFYALNALILQIVGALLNFTSFKGNFGNSLFETGYIKSGGHAKFSNPEIDYAWFNGLWQAYHWYPFVPLITSIVLLYVLVMICIALVLRIFNILTLYVISPFPIVTSVSDDYSKLIKWKDLLFAKYLEVCIFIITTGIYFGLFNAVESILLHPLIKASWWIYVLGLFIVAIAGSIYLLHGQALLCAILGTNTQIEQAQEHLGGGFRTATLLVASGAAFGLKALGGGAKLAAGAAGKFQPKNSNPSGLSAPLKGRLNNFASRNLKGISRQVGQNNANKKVSQGVQGNQVNRRN